MAITAAAGRTDRDAEPGARAGGSGANPGADAEADARADPGAATAWRRPVLPVILGALAVGLAAAALVFEPALHRVPIPGFVGRFALYRMLSALTFAVLGVVLCVRRPRNALGWLFIAMALLHGGSLMAEGYGLAGVWHQWDVPGAGWSVWVGEWLSLPAYWLLAVVLLLCPDGRPASRRWRPFVAVAVAAIVLSALGWMFLDPAKSDVRTHPAGFSPPAPVWGIAPALQAAGALLGAVAAVAAIWSLAVRYREASGVRRAQVKWVAVGGVATVVVLVGAFFEPPPGGWLIALSAVPLPLAITVAVLRHGLWDVDVVINRAVVYGTLTAAVLAVYAGVVVGLGDALGRTTGAPLLATALVAVGVQPARERLGRLANRLVYGYRDEPAEALRALAERLDAAAGNHDVLPDAVASLARALRLPFAEVAVDGDTVASGAPGGRDRERFPLVYRGATVGHLDVELPAGGSLTAGARRTLTGVARQLAVIVHARQLAADLERSRQRLAMAREEERRRLRRDLHDGLGPTLAAMAMQVDRAGLLARSDPDASEALLAQVSGRIRQTVGEVRTIVEDLGVPEIDESGLAGGIERLVARFTGGGLDVRLEMGPMGPDLPAAVEEAAYRIVAEALTNVVRHAHARTCVIDARVGDHALRLRIADDGVGMPAAIVHGVGLESMRARAAELAGSFDIQAADGGGTVVCVVLPVPGAGG